MEVDLQFCVDRAKQSMMASLGHMIMASKKEEHYKNNMLLLKQCMRDTERVVSWLDSIIYAEQIGKDKANAD